MVAGGTRAAAVAFVFTLTLATGGCGGTAEDGASGSTSGGSTCSGQGAAYDVAKSRFAFGGTPRQEPFGGGTRWVGADGILIITREGSVHTSMNAGADARGVPDFSADVDALTARVRAYFVAHGVAECQILSTQVTSGNTGGHVVHLRRGFDGIVVGESRAFARMTNDDVTTLEGLYWPAIDDAVVAAARAFRDRLADPAKLAEYRAKLPANAQGEGAVVIHHTSDVVMPGESKPFRAAPTWDVVPSDAGTTGVPVSFDENGARVAERW